MSIHAECLNCGAATSQNFCGVCGQKASTHRFSLKHIFAHDFIHGVFHVDKGILFTLKELMTRPGHSIREYITGKRVNHFNYVTFILLIIAANILLTKSTGFCYIDLTDQKVITSFDIISNLQRDHYKSLMLLTITLSAGISYLFFLKAKLNFAEHLVLNAYRSGGELLLQTVFLAIAILFRKLSAAPLVIGISGIIILVYNVWFYRQFFRPYYRTGAAVTWRAIVAYLLANFTMTVIVFATLYYTGYLQTLIKEMTASGGAQ